MAITPAANMTLAGKGEPNARREPSAAPHICRERESIAITMTMKIAAHSILPISRESLLKPERRMTMLYTYGRAAPYIATAMRATTATRA